MFPVIKYDHWIQLNVMFKIFISFTVLRLIKLMFLLAGRNGFSSKFVRYFINLVDWSNVIAIFAIFIFCTLPFALLQASFSNKSAT